MRPFRTDVIYGKTLKCDSGVILIIIIIVILILARDNQITGITSDFKMAYNIRRNFLEN